MLEGRYAAITTEKTVYSLNRRDINVLSLFSLQELYMIIIIVFQKLPKFTRCVSKRWKLLYYIFPTHIQSFCKNLLSRFYYYSLFYPLCSLCRRENGLSRLLMALRWLFMSAFTINYFCAIVIDYCWRVTFDFFPN